MGPQLGYGGSFFSKSYNLEITILMCTVQRYLVHLSCCAARTKVAEERSSNPEAVMRRQEEPPSPPSTPDGRGRGNDATEEACRGQPGPG